MKYVVIDVETGLHESEPLDCGATAASEAKRLTRNKGRKYRVIRIVAETTAIPDWHLREMDRFSLGEYKPLPWANEPWVIREHFAHVSKNDAAKIAFTRNSEHGEADRQTAMRPGRYLSEFYSQSLTLETIKEWCAKYAKDNKIDPLQFATTPDEIQWAYENGPPSCMSHHANHYSSPVHPVRVYGAGDLAIAYTLNDSGRVSARTLCWPKKKIYSRIYGDENLLRDLLDDARYSEGRKRDFNGAKLLRIEYDGAFVAPYFDHPNSNVEDNGEFLIVNCMGEYECSTTHGLTEIHEECSYCGEKTTGETYQVQGDTYCEHCYSEHCFYCEDCSTDYYGNSVCINGRCLCEACAYEYSACDYCGEQYIDLTEGYDGAHYCDYCCNHELKETPCGLPAENEDDCDCNECERWRKDHTDMFGEIVPDTPIRLPQTTPTINDPNQLSFLHPWKNEIMLPNQNWNWMT